MTGTATQDFVHVVLEAFNYLKSELGVRCFLAWACAEKLSPNEDLEGTGIDRIRMNFPEWIIEYKENCRESWEGAAPEPAKTKYAGALKATAGDPPVEDSEPTEEDLDMASLHDPNEPGVCRTCGTTLKKDTILQHGRGILTAYICPRGCQ